MTIDELPETSTLFYRSRFEIFPDDKIQAEIWPQIIRVLQDWLEKKEKKRDKRGLPSLVTSLTEENENYAAHFDETYQNCHLSKSFAQGTFSKENSITYLSSISSRGEGTELVPQYWAFDYIERDSRHDYRRWRTNVGITSSTSGTYIVNVRVSIYDDATFMGQAPIPERNTPNFIAELLDIKNCVTLSGELELTSTVVDLTEDNFDSFIEDLESDTRIVPLVVISAYWDRDDASTRFILDPNTFARKMAGSAIVYTLNRANSRLRTLYAKRFLDDDEARNYRIPNGGLRVFLPGLKLSDGKGHYRHRYYANNWLRVHRIESVSDDICVGISRLYRQQKDEVVDPRGVLEQEARIRRQELSEKYRQLKHERSAFVHFETQGMPQESSADLEKENKLLREKLDKAEEMMEFYEGYIDELENTQQDSALEERVVAAERENEKLSNDAARLKYDLSRYQEEVRGKEEKIASLQNQIKTWDGIKAFPSKPLESLKLSKRLFADRLVFLKEAETSAKKFLGNTFETYQVLKAINDVLWPMLFQQDFSGNIESEFENQTGFELSFKETKATKKDPALMKLRERQYNGSVILITPHIKGNTGSKDAVLRVHFYVDEKAKVIVIGHCGSHMQTSGARRKK